MSDVNENADISASSRSDTEYDAPPTQTGSMAGGDQEFDPPPLGDDGGDGAGGDSEASAAIQRLRAVKEMVEERLVEAAAANAMSLAGAQHKDSAGVVGVGLSGAGIPGQSSLVVYVESDASEEQVRREMVDTMGVQAASRDDLPVDVEVTGPIEAFSTNRSKFRPAPGGVSVGHLRVTAGTIGGWARARGDRARRLLMVSNNHILAASNAGRFGDPIVQPGPADGGVDPADRLAILERFVSIDFSSGATNYVDCATAWCWPDRVRRDHVYHRGATALFFNIGNTVIEPRQNMVVGKTGRTTDLTQGTIRAVGVSVNVSFGAAGVAHFRDQFSVRSTNARDFSDGGDSGSFVWQWNTRLSPVGLLFAGGGGTTFCNRMSRVVKALEITLNEAS